MIDGRFYGLVGTSSISWDIFYQCNDLDPLILAYGQILVISSVVRKMVRNYISEPHLTPRYTVVHEGTKGQNQSL
jgi:hypothetical protein